MKHEEQLYFRSQFKTIMGKDMRFLCFSNPGREYAGLQSHHSPLHIYVQIGMFLSAKVISRCKNQCFTSTQGIQRLSTNRCCFADYLNHLPMCHIRKGGALGVGSIIPTIIRRQLQSLHTPISQPFSLQMSRYDFFFLSLGTGGTSSCCCMLRSVSLQAGDRIP